MESWSTHQLEKEARKLHGSTISQDLVLYAKALQAKGVAVIFDLNHLSTITGVGLRLLQSTVNRTRESTNYRMYAVSKRSGGRRFIHAVSSELSRVQSFINREILQRCRPHPRSFAFHASGGIRKCAEQHREAKWIFQFDLSDFFYYVTEDDCFRIFAEVGYTRLLSFELARLCTTTHLPRAQKARLYEIRQLYLQSTHSQQNLKSRRYPRRADILGVLPQGAPTSPMLSNLAARRLDASLDQFAERHSLVYTRYADDITISASNKPESITLGGIYSSVISHVRAAGFRENEKKTRIARPGSKKVVLGLLVDGPKPRLTKETYHRIDRHLHATLKYGLSETAKHEGFESAFGFYNHLKGLVDYVKDVDTERWSEFTSRFRKVEAPWR
jgi:RNA-directed DNA polymerase